MSLKRFTEVALIVFAIMILLYNYIGTYGTDCYDKLTMNLTIFMLIYSIILRWLV